jgi:hypothetical protein
VASCAGRKLPSTQASSAVVVGAATSSAMAAYLARGARPAVSEWAVKESNLQP